MVPLNGFTKAMSRISSWGWLHMAFPRIIHRWVSLWEKIPHSSVCGCLQRYWSGCLVAPSSQWRGHKEVDGEWSKMIVWDAWEHGLHAPEVEELPCGLAQIVQWSSPWSNYCLEAVASEDLWIWHCFFHLPGSLDDVNVLQRFFSSPST
jgi:hypothetical protein